MAVVRAVTVLPLTLLVIFSTYLGIVDALGTCHYWPSHGLYLITNKAFYCTGKITAVKVCRKKDLWIHVRTWSEDSSGIISDSQLEDVVVETKNTFTNLRNAMEYKAGDKFGFEFYDTEAVQWGKERCMIPFTMTSSKSHQCKKLEIVFKVTQNCYKEKVQPSSSTTPKPTPKPTATQSTLPTPSIGNLLRASVSPTQTSTNCASPNKTTGTPFFYAFVAASAIASILLAALITFGTCTLCCGVWRAELDNDGKTGENPSVLREERPVPVSHDGAYTLYTPHSHHKTVQSVDNTYETVTHSANYPKLERGVVELQTRIGSELYCEVYKGKMQSEGGPISVSVKVVSSQEKGQGRLQALQEASILAQFDHPNIVKLFGVINKGNPIMIVTEYLPVGPLKVYLGKLRGSEHEEQELSLLLLKFCQQIAEGMRYLSSMGFVHKELSARNIQLDESLNCKITGFQTMEASRDLYSTAQGQMPAKWTAPEGILYGDFTTKSDVWSYGMVMYEIWSLGHKPFEKTTADKVPEMIESGYVHPPPPGCPRAVYKVMIQCWNRQGDSRPRFGDLVAIFKRDTELLQWTEEDRHSSKNASTLGADLSEGKNLYKELQETYTQE